VLELLKQVRGVLGGHWAMLWGSGERWPGVKAQPRVMGGVQSLKFNKRPKTAFIDKFIAQTPIILIHTQGMGFPPIFPLCIRVPPKSDQAVASID
jgi:hypothetical protein